MSCAERSDEECSLIRSNLMNDECMKLVEEDRCLFENLSACSASGYDIDSSPDSSNSNACPSDLALSMSSCARSSEEAPAIRETAKDNGKVVSSLELHGCEHLVFLKLFSTNVTSCAVLAIRIQLVSLICRFCRI